MVLALLSGLVSAYTESVINQSDVISADDFPTRLINGVGLVAGDAHSLGVTYMKYFFILIIILILYIIVKQMRGLL
jgi:hypothetical protein